jgi:diacylglycerol O-acyltransferase
VVARLSSLDVSFLYMEQASTPMHLGGVAIFDPPESGYHFDDVAALIRSRLPLVPRYHQRVREVPGHLAAPVWVDDASFDFDYHVRRSALPRPGNDEQLFELAARLSSRPLDVHRPLWELYVVEGLAGGRFAVVSKTHPAMVDGLGAVDVAQVLLDPSPDATVPDDVMWQPRPEPSSWLLFGQAVAELASRPGAVVDAVRGGVSDVRHTAGRLGGVVGEALSMARSVARPVAVSPLSGGVGSARRFAAAHTSLADLKTVRAAHGGTVNDIVLTVVTGALRSWLMTRGEPVTSGTTVRALVPVSLRAVDGGGPASSDVTAHVIDLPVGEPSPVVRLHQVSYGMASVKEGGQAAGADALLGLAGFAPPTLHALGARAASGLSRRLFSLVVTNVPGPQTPLYAGGARLVAAYPLVPLARGQALSIGVTSYDGGVFIGLYADREALPDLDVLAGLIDDSLVELLEAAPGRPGRS